MKIIVTGSLGHIGRPLTYFYNNLFGFIPMIKAAGFIGAVYGEEDKLAMVSPRRLFNQSVQIKYAM